MSEDSVPTSPCTTRGCCRCGQADELAQLEASIATYYDSLTDEEVEEERLWGEFCDKQLTLVFETEKI